MGIEEEIFEEFCKKLESDDEIPKAIVNMFRDLYTKEKISKESVLKSIRKGCSDENQEH